MFNKYIKKIKEGFIKKTEGNNKKNIENLIVFLVLLIITIIAINTIWGTNKPKTNEDNVTNSTYRKLAINEENIINSNNIEDDEYNLKDSLEDILGKISGVR